MRRLLLAAAMALAAPGAAQELIYALPGGASSDTISTPNAFAAPEGVYYIAVSAHTEPKWGDALDGLAVMGVGTGTVQSAVEFSIVTSDLDRLSGQFLSLKWHFHNETAAAPAIAVGVEDVTAEASRRPTAYIAATKTFWDTSARSAFLMRKTVSAGFGGGRFHSRLFGAASVSLDAFSKAIIEYDGRRLNAGLSVAQPMTRRSVMVMVMVLGRQRFNKPGQRAWTMSLALAWQKR